MRRSAKYTKLVKERLNAGCWSKVVTVSLGMNLCRHVEDVFPNRTHSSKQTSLSMSKQRSKSLSPLGGPPARTHQFSSCNHHVYIQADFITPPRHHTLQQLTCGNDFWILSLFNKHKYSTSDKSKQEYGCFFYLNGSGSK